VIRAQRQTRPHSAVNRTSFLAAVHELAEQLGSRLYALVEKQSERARAAALEIAKGKLRAELQPDDKAAPVETAPPPRKRRQQRCSKCQSTEHNARGCDENADDESRAEAAAQAPVVVTPPLTEARPLRQHRIRRCDSSRGASTNLHRAGRSRVTAARNCSPCPS